MTGLGSNVVVSSAQVKRRDAGDIELMLFTGEQGAASPYKLSDNFEMRFACKAVNDWDGDAVVLEPTFAWRPTDQVYVATPNFNTSELNALFAAVSGVEPASVTLMAEFSWRDLGSPSKWTSTDTFEIVVKNDVIRGDEGDPSSAADPTIYATKSELATGYVKTTTQSLTDPQKLQARQNIEALGPGEAVSYEDQDPTTEQAEQARENIGAAAAADRKSVV